MAALTRRRFLGSASAVAVLAAGAGAGALLGSRRDVRPAPVAIPQAPAALSAAIARERALLGACRDAAAAPGAAERIAPIAAEHTEHLRVLAAELARITGAATVDTAAPSASGPAAAPGSLADQLSALADVEAAAAADGTAACLDGLGGDPALADLHVLLGCIAASETVHAAMLR